MLSSNFFHLRTGFLALLLLVALATSSCKDDTTEPNPDPNPDPELPEDPDDVEEDTELPTVSITGLPENGIVRNTVTLTVTAADNVGIDKVVLTVDDVTVATETEASFPYELSSLTLDDGEHTIAATASDTTGNEKTAQYTFTVQNVVLSIDVPAVFLNDANKKGFVLLSDADGETIVSHEYHDGEAIRLTAPDFEGDEFYVTEVYIDPGTSTQELRTYSHVQRGATWALTPPRPGSGTLLGQATVDFSNRIPNINYLITSNGTSSFLRGTNTQIKINLKTTPSRLLIIRSATNDLENMTHYMLTDPVAVGTGNPVVDLSLVSNALTIVDTNLSAGGYQSAETGIFGLATAGDFTAPYSLSIFPIDDNNHIKYHYPGNAFPVYYSRTSLYGNDFSVLNYVDGLPDFNPLPSTIDIQVDNVSITGSVTGDDVDFAEFYTTYTANKKWYFFAPKGTVDLVVPDLPNDIASLLSLQSANPVFTASAVQKFGDVDDYESFLDYVRTSGHGSRDIGIMGTTFKRYDQEVDFTAMGRLRP
jgi:hypothetical protein